MFLVDLKVYSVCISSALRDIKCLSAAEYKQTADSSDALQALQHKQQICVHIYPTCLLKRINHDPSGERATWCISRPRREPPGRTETVSAPSEQKPSPWNPLHPFLEIFSGRNCAVLKQIYFNTRHNIWTNKKKKKNIFIFFYQGAKKNREENIWVFFGLPVLHSDF